MQIAVIDNYDSFTYNLVHYLEDIIKSKVDVMRNDEIDWDHLDSCTHIVLSPGPGIPIESGDLMKVIERYHSTKKILGVCLGHQGMAEFFGAKLINDDRVFHGMSTLINISNHECLFRNLKPLEEVGRYHSWHVSSDHWPEELIVTSRDRTGMIMSFRHKDLPLYGVQFHPESIMSLSGKKMLENFVLEN